MKTSRSACVHKDPDPRDHKGGELPEDVPTAPGVRTPLYDLLKEGVMIQYRDGVMMIWVPDKTAKSLVRILDLVEECFGVALEEVEVYPTTAEAHALRLEFPYSFAGPHVTTEDGPRGVSTGRAPKDCDHKDPQDPCVHKEIQEAVPTPPEGWYRLTDRVCYRVEDGEVVLGHLKGKKVVTMLKADVEELKKLYKALPEECDAAELRRHNQQMGMTNLYGRETYLLRLFANYVGFGGELLRVGRTLRLVKDSQYLREENRRKLSQEMQVIGTSWG